MIWNAATSQPLPACVVHAFPWLCCNGSQGESVLGWGLTVNVLWFWRSRQHFLHFIHWRQLPAGPALSEGSDQQHKVCHFSRITQQLSYLRFSWRMRTESWLIRYPKEAASPFPHNSGSPLEKREIPSFSFSPSVRAELKETHITGIVHPKVKSLVPWRSYLICPVLAQGFVLLMPLVECLLDYVWKELAEWGKKRRLDSTKEQKWEIKRCLRKPYPLLDLDFPVHLRNRSNWSIRGKFWNYFFHSHGQTTIAKPWLGEMTLNQVVFRMCHHASHCPKCE